MRASCGAELGVRSIHDDMEADIYRDIDKEINRPLGGGGLARRLSSTRIVISCIHMTCSPSQSSTSSRSSTDSPPGPSRPRHRPRGGTRYDSTRRVRMAACAYLVDCHFHVVLIGRYNVDGPTLSDWSDLIEQPGHIRGQRS